MSGMENVKIIPTLQILNEAKKYKPTYGQPINGNLGAAASTDKAGLANEVLFIIFLDISLEIRIAEALEEAICSFKTTPTNTTPPQPILPKTVPNRYSTTTTTRRLPRRKREKEKGWFINYSCCSSTIHAAPSTTNSSSTIHAASSSTTSSSTIHAAPSTTTSSSTIHAAPSTATSSSTTHAASSTTTTPTIHASPSTTYISSTTHAASSGSPTTHAAP
ncbi:hypothetical protein ACTFIW_012047 [Dictyostelium discoideum]